MILDTEALQTQVAVQNLILLLLSEAHCSIRARFAQQYFHIIRVVLLTKDKDKFLNSKRRLSVRGMMLQAREFEQQNFGYTPNDLSRRHSYRVWTLDTEMVKTSSGDLEIARVTLLDRKGRQLIDEYCTPRGKIIDYLTQYSGITPMCLKHCRPFAAVRCDLASLIRQYQPILLGHGLDNDLKALKFRYPFVIDTASLLTTRKTKLSFLAYQILGRTIYDGEHSSFEDCNAILDIFKAIKRAGVFDFSTKSSRIVRDVYGVGRSFRDQLNKGKVLVGTFQPDNADEYRKYLILCQTAAEYSDALKAYGTTRTLFICERDNSWTFEYE